MRFLVSPPSPYGPTFFSPRVCINVFAFRLLFRSWKKPSALALVIFEFCVLSVTRIVCAANFNKQASKCLKSHYQYHLPTSIGSGLGRKMGGGWPCPAETRKFGEAHAGAFILQILHRRCSGCWCCVCVCLPFVPSVAGSVVLGGFYIARAMHARRRTPAFDSDMVALQILWFTKNQVAAGTGRFRGPMPMACSRGWRLQAEPGRRLVVR